MHVYTPHTYASHTYIQDTCIILTAYTRPQILTEYTTPYTLSISHPHCKRATCKHTHAKLYILTPHIPTPHHSHTHTTARYTHHTRAHRHSTTVTSHTWKHIAHTSHSSHTFCVQTHTHTEFWVHSPLCCSPNPTVPNHSEEKPQTAPPGVLFSSWHH